MGIGLELSEWVLRIGRSYRRADTLWEVGPKGKEG